MPSIRVTEFGGMKPRDVRSYGGPSRASLARDVKLDHGMLQPWRYPAKEIDTEQTLCSIFKHGCCWIGSCNPCADFTYGDTDCKRIFSTGMLDYPAYAELPDCSNGCGEYIEPDWCRLGIPKPQNAPTIDQFTHTENEADCTQCEYGVEKKRESRAYLYTYVNEYGEESEASPISEVILADIDSSARVLFSIPPMTDGFCDPLYIRVYRAGTGATEEGSWETAQSDFLMVDEFPYSSGNLEFIDDIPVEEVGMSYMGDCNKVPPQDLEGITSLGNGTLVGFRHKEIWFSEPWKFNAWDCYMNVDHCVKAIAVEGQYLYVATNGNPYVIDIDNHEEACKCCRVISMVSETAPITSKRSMVATNNGVMWATNDGLARFSGGSFRIDTHSHITSDDWLKWYPHDLNGVYHKGMYFGFNSERGFIWDMTDGVYSDTYLGENGKFTELSLTPKALYRTEQNELYMSFDKGIYKWDASSVYMPYRWRTKLHVEGGLMNYSVLKIVFEKWLRTRKSPNAGTVRLYADGKMMFQRKVTCSRPFRLPKGYDALNWEIEIEGIENIMELHMATSMNELVLLNNV